MVDLDKNGHEVQIVLIERLDRLARDIMTQEAIIRDLTKMGVQLISVDEGPDLASDDPTRELLRVFIGAVAQYEKRILVLKLRAARERKREREGKCEGAKAYGEDSPEEQAVIKRIRLLRRRRKGKHPGMTYKQIAELLNAEGIRTKKGRTWRAQSVYHVARHK
jgi:DNA invertase Pin-like site-specific DNA recombinase